VYRVAYLLERGVPPDRILLVTFTNKAAREMMERVQSLLGSQPRGLWGGTFHSVANRVLRQYAKSLGFTNDFGILDSDDSKKLVTQIYHELGIRKDKYFPKAAVMHGILSFAKNSQRPLAELLENNYSYLSSEIWPVIERIAQEYEAKKREANVMDFDDLLINWLRIMRDVPEVGKRLAEQFQYVLVDEFQDTNTVQAELVRALAEPQRNILVVGDDAQSIYSFRAATVENILTFQKHFPEAKIFKLEMNYRSTPEILRLANESIRNNRFQFDKQLQTNQGVGDKPALIPVRDQQQQASVICQRVLELRQKGLALDEMVVLFRSSYQIIELELQLGRSGIPYIVRGGLRFFEQAHIKDVLAYLKILQNPVDEVSWRRVLSLYPGIGPSTANKIWAVLKQHDDLSSMLSALAMFPAAGKGRPSLELLQRLLLSLRDYTADISLAIRYVLEQGYQVYVEASFDDPKERIEDLLQLSIFSTNYKTLGDFLSEASLSEGFKGDRGGSGSADGADEHLVLSTIHQAKGLEWDAVFCLGLAEGQFPHYRVAEKPKEMEEERRLFYVVVTRARKHLHLLYPIMSRSASAGQVINRPSIFLREVDEGLFETWEVSEAPYGGVRLKLSSGASTDGEMVYISEEEEFQQEKKKGSILDMMRGI
jgi:DNA helicase-2/ATP-dependent DNA helicase PcrA